MCYVVVEPCTFADKLLVLILIGLGDGHRLAIMLLSILASWHVAGDRMRACILLEAVLVLLVGS